MCKAFFLSCLLFIGVSGCVVPTYTGSSALHETEVNKSVLKYQRILMVGAGSTPSRFFLENFSAELAKFFKQYDVTADFTYVGKIPKRSQVDINNLITPKYNAYLVFTPMDTAYANTHKDVAMIVTPFPGGYATGSAIGNQYKEDFYVALYTKGDSLFKHWQGDLRVDFDFANPSRYRKMAKNLVDMLAKNGLVSKMK